MQRAGLRAKARLKVGELLRRHDGEERPRARLTLKRGNRGEDVGHGESRARRSDASGKSCTSGTDKGLHTQRSSAYHVLRNVRHEVANGRPGLPGEVSHATVERLTSDGDRLAGVGQSDRLHGATVSDCRHRVKAGRNDADFLGRRAATVNVADVGDRRVVHQGGAVAERELQLSREGRSDGYVAKTCISNRGVSHSRPRKKQGEQTGR